MLDFDFGKLVIIGVVALVAIPSKDLPRVLRQLGQLTGKMRRMAAEFQSQFHEALREAELHETRASVENEVKSAIAGAGLDGSFDPLATVRKELKEAVEGPPAAETLAPPMSAPLASPEPAAKPEPGA